MFLVIRQLNELPIEADHFTDYPNELIYSRHKTLKNAFLSCEGARKKGRRTVVVIEPATRRKLMKA
jgi:hypothetical protein